MRALLVSVALVGVACGRYGFDPQRRTGGDASGDGAAGDGAPDGAALCQWLASCMAGAFTCCSGSSRSCVQNVQQCPTGDVAQCDPNPPFTPCNAGEICCIVPPETYLRCVPATGQC